MIQPNARRPVSTAAIENRRPVAGTGGRPVTTMQGTAVRKHVSAMQGAPTRRPGAPVVAPTRRPVSTAAIESRRPVSTAAIATRRPTVHAGAPARRPGTSVVAPTRRTGVRPTGATVVRRPGVHSTGATVTRRPGVHSTGATVTRRTGVHHAGATVARRTGAHPAGAMAARRQAMHTGTARRPVTGWPHHGKKHHHAHPAGTATQHTPVYRGHPGMKTTVIRHGRHTPGVPGGYVEYIQQGYPGQPAYAGQPMYAGQPAYPGPAPAGSYGSCPGASSASGASAPGTATPGMTAPGMTEPTATGYVTPGHITPGPAATGPTTTVPSTPRRPCHTCGTSVRGCTTLSRFAFNSAELKSSHKAQLRQLAERILRQKSNTVIATGHADSSGTEDYNEILGEKRAAAVVRELKKQMRLLKPGSQKLLLWKIDSKGESSPVSQTDAAANRRVTICVRKASLSR